MAPMEKSKSYSLQNQVILGYRSAEQGLRSFGYGD
jgi:hypothetical protein